MTNLVRNLSELGVITAGDALVAVSPVTVRKRVMFGECDPAGVAYTPRFADYLMLAHFWMKYVLMHGLPPLTVDMPMRGLDLDFRHMLATDDIFDMQCRIGAIRNRTYDMMVEAHLGDKIAFTGRLTAITFDHATQSSVALPQTYRERLEAYQRMTAR